MFIANGMNCMNWKKGFTDESIVAQAEIAPIEIVAQMLQMYKEDLDGGDHNYFFSPYESIAEFELAVFNRNNNYLNLILATTVTDGKVANALWDYSNTDGELSLSCRNAIKESLLKSHSLTSLLNEDKWGNKKESKVSLAQLLSAPDFNATYVSAILSNPYSKGLIDKILLKKGDFSSIPSERLPSLVTYISRNPAINTDRSDSNGPDLTHWNAKDAIEETILNAPVNLDWFYALYDLINRIEPEGFSFYKFPFESFIDKWVGFKTRDDSNSSEDDDLSGLYTNLSEAEEFVATFCAKFGRTLNQDKKLKLSDALSEKNIAIKSAFLGNAYLTSKEISEALNEFDSHVAYCLLLNNSVLRNTASREQIKDCVSDSNLQHLFNRRIEYLKKIEPTLFSNEPNHEGRIEDQIKSISETTSQLSKNIDGLMSKLSNAEDVIKNLRNIGIFLLVVLILKECS